MKRGTALFSALIISISLFVTPVKAAQASETYLQPPVAGRAAGDDSGLIGTPNTDNIAPAGWTKLNDGWYYFNNSNGLYDSVMDLAKKSEWLLDNGLWYYLGEDGIAKYNEWANIKGRWYYFDGGCRMRTGWLRQLSFTGRPIWYYLQPSGSMATGWKRIGTSDGQWYYFNDNGTMRTGWKKHGGLWFYMKADGTMARGWVKVDGHWYYARPDKDSPAPGDEGAILQGGQWKIGGKTYSFDGSGQCILY